MKYAKVGGWGQVEKTAESWCAGAVVTEVERCLWHVRASDGSPIGVIGKDPWTPEEIERRAIALAGAAP